MMRVPLLASLALLFLACGGMPATLPPSALALDRPPVSHVAEPTPGSVVQLPAIDPTPEPQAVSQAAQKPTTAPAPPAPVYRWRVVGPGVNVAIVGAVGVPCTGQRPPVPWGGAYWDSCKSNWLMAHPAFFGAMNGWAIGTAVSYWDGDRVEHVYHVTSNQVFGPGASVPDSFGAMTFQVCTDNIANGSPVRVLGTA